MSNGNTATANSSPYSVLRTQYPVLIAILVLLWTTPAAVAADPTPDPEAESATTPDDAAATSDDDA